VGPNPVKEIGWHSVRGTETATARHWLGEQMSEAELFHWHGETFSLPEGAELLLENDNCAHQAFAIGNTLALQCHVEMTAPMVAEWASLYADELHHPAASVQSAEQMTTGLDDRIRAAQQVADRLYQRWLEPVLNP
jgi:GMP synthase-like glutamine amidotransferase